MAWNPIGGLMHTEESSRHLLELRKVLTMASLIQFFYPPKKKIFQQHFRVTIRGWAEDRRFICLSECFYFNLQLFQSGDWKEVPLYATGDEEEVGFLLGLKQLSPAPLWFALFWPFSCWQYTGTKVTTVIIAADPFSQQRTQGPCLQSIKSD